MERGAHPKSFEPGELVVETHCGPGRVAGLERRDGQTFVVVQHRTRGTCAVPEAEVSSRLRRAMPPPEAQRLLGLLQAQDGGADERPWALRVPEFERARARGSAEDKARMLHRLYRSPYAESPGEERVRRDLEQELLEEISAVLDVPRPVLEDRVHGLHPAFRRGAPVRPEPRRPTSPHERRPKSPVRISGLDFLGTFAVGEALAVGDPAFLSSSFDDLQDAAPFNFRQRARPGEWLAFVREGWGHTCMVSAVHRDHAARFGALIEEAQPIQTVYAESGQMAFVDAALREDEGFRDALLAAPSPHIVKERGCIVGSRLVAGVYRVMAALRNGQLVLVSVDLDIDMPSDDDED